MGLSGKLPLDGQLWSRLSSLQEIDLDNNRLSGFVPPQLVRPGPGAGAARPPRLPVLTGWALGSRPGRLAALFMHRSQVTQHAGCMLYCCQKTSFAGPARAQGPARRRGEHPRSCVHCAELALAAVRVCGAQARAARSQNGDTGAEQARSTLRIPRRCAWRRCRRCGWPITRWRARCRRWSSPPTWRTSAWPATTCPVRLRLLCYGRIIFPVM